MLFSIVVDDVSPLALIAIALVYNAWLSANSVLLNVVFSIPLSQFTAPPSLLGALFL